MRRRGTKIPRLPRLYCGRILNHRGYLRELRPIDEHTAEYVCQACGWRGVLPRTK